MKDKGKVIPIDKTFREQLKALGHDSLDGLPPMSEAERDELLKDPKISREGNLKELTGYKKELEEKIIGIRNSKGGFTCIDCIAQEVWEYIGEDRTVTLLDSVRNGDLPECDNCRKRVGSNGNISFIQKKGG